MKTKINIFLVMSVLVLVIAGFGADDPEVINSKERLGEKLFFDPILSKDKSISCASCHKPEFAFADTAVVSIGVGGTRGSRNSPSVTNLSGRPNLFWDGRVSSLEDQALQPIINPVEMNLPIAEAIARLKADKTYTELFQKIFNAAPTEKNLLQAIASFERTLETANSPYDRYIDGDDLAISASAQRGRLLFIGKANCNNCHSGEDFTADRFKGIGLFNEQDLNDAGRFDVTKNPEHKGHFKIPGLRNVALTAPYMHNGIFKTLKEVIRYYNNPDEVIKNGKNRDLSLSKPLGLSETDINDLESFLIALTDDRFIKKIDHQK